MQQTNICDWTLVISALAISIPNLAAAVVLWIKSKAEFQHSRARQYEIVQKIEDVKSEQIAVKEALNGNGH